MRQLGGDLRYHAQGQQIDCKRRIKNTLPMPGWTFGFPRSTFRASPTKELLTWTLSHPSSVASRS